MSHPYKDLPKKLEDELNDVKYYKRKNSNPTVDKLLANLNNPTNNENHLNYQSSLDDISSHHTSQRQNKASSMQRVFDDSYENKMYDEIFGGLLPSANRPKLPAGSGFDATRRSSSQEKDFTSSLINRLKVLESENKEQRKQLSQQIADNLKLEERLRVFETSVNQQDRDNVLKTQRLVQENKRLLLQINEMEAFLADYGLQWVGNQGYDETYDEKEGKEGEGVQGIGGEDSRTEGHLVRYIDFERSIKQLNEIIYSEPAQIRAEKEKKKARLVSASELVEKIRVTYYKDGLMINRGPFRPTHSASYKTFVGDIMDGYFPSEFRDTYPDGVIFELHNKETVCYEEGGARAKTGAGAGSGEEGEFMSMKEFLHRLPKTVIKNGDVIDLHKDVRMRLSLDGADVIRMEADREDKAVGDADDSEGENEGVVKERESKRKQSQQKTEGRVRQHQIITIPTEAGDHHSGGGGEAKTTKIQVKWKDSISFIAILYNYQTIGDLRKLLVKYHLKQEKDKGVTSSSFELRRSFPTRKLEDYETFQSADLVPNGILHTHFLR